MKGTVIEIIANLCEWSKTCHPNYQEVCDEKIERWQNTLPHGSGFDNGCKIDVANSGKKNVDITFDWHNMDECGGYIGWTSYLLVVTPSFGTPDMMICCTDGIDEQEGNYDYFYDCFRDCLLEEVND